MCIRLVLAQYMSACRYRPRGAEMGEALKQESDKEQGIARGIGAPKRTAAQGSRQ
jgi:hypothetical protein